MHLNTLKTLFFGKGSMKWEIPFLLAYRLIYQ